jgi:hypothetical protein
LSSIVSNLVRMMPSMLRGVASRGV